MGMFFHVFISNTLLISCSYGISRWDVFSTKTNYKWAHTTTATTDESYLFPTGLQTCKAIHVSMVTRHGARWPSDMEEIKDLHAKIVESKSRTAFPALDLWTPRYDEADEKQLTPGGKKEQQDLGARIGMRFKTLFDNNGKYVKFVSSSKSRSKDSSEYFHNGLSSIVLSVTECTNQINDTLIRPYDECEKYEETVETDKNMRQFIEFSKSSTVTNITDSAKEKLGLSDSLSSEDINLINELCAYEKAIYDEENVWCNLQTDEDRLILEYRNDIENYYENSYGHQINTRRSCLLLSDMFHTMDKAINNAWNYSKLGDVTEYGYLAGKFYNGHSDTIIPLMTSLELFKDNEALLSTNMDTMANRKFRTSVICPSSANLAFALYACDGSNTSDRTFMLKLFVNEQPVTIPACIDDTCSYETVRQYYSDLIDRCTSECDDDVCDDDNETCKASCLGISIVLISFVLLYLIIL